MIFNIINRKGRWKKNKIKFWFSNLDLCFQIYTLIFDSEYKLEFWALKMKEAKMNHQFNQHWRVTSKYCVVWGGPKPKRLKTTSLISLQICTWQLCWPPFHWWTDGKALLTLCIYFRMAEPRFNNPYFWPPPPAMHGQVSDSGIHNYYRYITVKVCCSKFF